MPAPCWSPHGIPCLAHGADSQRGYREDKTTEIIEDTENTEMVGDTEMMGMMKGYINDRGDRNDGDPTTIKWEGVEVATVQIPNQLSPYYYVYLNNPRPEPPPTNFPMITTMILVTLKAASVTALVTWSSLKYHMMENILVNY